MPKKAEGKYTCLKCGTTGLQRREPCPKCTRLQCKYCGGKGRVLKDIEASETLICFEESPNTLHKAWVPCPECSNAGEKLLTKKDIEKDQALSMFSKLARDLKDPEIGAYLRISCKEELQLIRDFLAEEESEMTLEEAKVYINEWVADSFYSSQYRKEYIDKLIAASEIIGKHNQTEKFKEYIEDYSCKSHNGSHCCDNFNTYFDKLLNPQD